MSLRVTAIIPCHNHERWVWKAVESIANQDYPNKRVVVVDDGSTDDSFTALSSRLHQPASGVTEGLQGNPEFVRGTFSGNGVEVIALRYTKASGPSFARNRGLELGMAAGDFEADIFALLDSDDIYEPGKISKSIRYFAEFPNHVGVVYSDYDTLREDGVRIREFKEPFSRQRLLRECIVNCDSLISRKAIEVCDGFDEKMRVAEDYDLWLRLSEHFVLIHIPEALVTIRSGPHSSTATVPREIWEQNWRRVMVKTQERARK